VAGGFLVGQVMKATSCGAAMTHIRTRGPYARLRALQAQDANVARYEAWRGGVRDDSKTGASVAMAILQRQVRVGAGIGLIGIAAIFTGLVMH
jgi:hypothetical protein